MSLMPIISPYKALPLCSLVGTPYLNTTAQTTYTFSGCNIGGPGLIVVVVHARQSTGSDVNLNSVTIGGNAATIHRTAKVASSSWICTSIASLRVASGTTADIVAAFGSPSRTACGISIYRITGNTSDTPVDIQSATTSSGSSLSVSIGMSVGGCCVAGATANTSGAFTWSGLTEDYDDNRYSDASVRAFSGASPLSVSATFASPNITALAAVSWR